MLHYLDSSLSHWYRAWYLAANCVPVSEMTETSSTLRRWTSARHVILTTELVWSFGILSTRSESMELSAYIVV